jgi:hypothetical protein
MNIITNHGGVFYYNAPVVCESHEGEPGGVIVESGMVSLERGLVCPLCYAVARPATPSEAETYVALSSACRRTCRGGK